MHTSQRIDAAAFRELEADNASGVLRHRAATDCLTLPATGSRPNIESALEQFQPAPGAFKIDYALSDPVPWRAADCRRAITVHLGGTFEEIAEAEYAVAHGREPRRPFVLVAQPTLFDPSRAPEGKHVLWAYCHVPNGSTFDMTERIEAQIERFAPGFRDCVLARHVSTPAALESMDANLVGGDISGGAMTLRQMFFRPTSERLRDRHRPICICVRHRRRRAEACTACAATMRRGSHCGK